MGYGWLPPPQLPEPYATALDEALAALDGRADLIAVLLAGSVVRGAPGPTSDLDLLCVIGTDVRQRRHLVTAGGVLVEMFLNPDHQIERYLAEERRTNGPSTATMLRDARILLDRQPAVLARLRAAARDMLAAGPDPLTGHDRERALYEVRNLFEDASDADAADPGTALLALSECARRAVVLHYALRRRWAPKTKNTPADLAAWDGEAAVRLLGTAADHDPAPAGRPHPRRRRRAPHPVF